jgi:hypothetical protein
VEVLFEDKWKQKNEKKLTAELYYDAHGVLGDIMDEDIELVAEGRSNYTFSSA